LRLAEAAIAAGAGSRIVPSSSSGLADLASDAASSEGELRRRGVAVPTDAIWQFMRREGSALKKRYSP